MNKLRTEGKKAGYLWTREENKEEAIYQQRKNSLRIFFLSVSRVNKRSLVLIEQDAMRLLLMERAEQQKNKKRTR